MCSSTGFVEKDLYHCSILTWFKSCILCLQMFQRVRMSSSISSSQSILRFQSSWINNFGSRMAGEIIPKGSNMPLIKLSIPRFVFGTSFYNTFTFGTFLFGSQESLKLFQVVFYRVQDLLVLVIKCYFEVTLKSYDCSIKTL